MQSNFRQHISTIAKQVAMPSWLAINSLGSDRTPEGYNSQGSMEDSV